MPFTLPSIPAREVLVLKPGYVLLDVRRVAARAASGQQVAGASWVDPMSLGHGHSLFHRGDTLVFYCAHGHEVSQFATALALVNGCEALFVEGGFDAMVAAGAMLEQVGT